MTDHVRRSKAPQTSLRELAAELDVGEQICALVAVASDGTILTWTHSDLEHPLHFDWAAKNIHAGAARMAAPDLENPSGAKEIRERRVAGLIRRSGEAA